MNYINRANAEHFKRLGFDVAVPAWYADSPRKNALHFHSGDNWNSFELSISAPDFLTAADWIAEKSKEKIGVAFLLDSAIVDVDLSEQKVFEDTDRRNNAIAYALTELEKMLKK